MIIMVQTAPLTKFETSYKKVNLQFVFILIAERSMVYPGFRWILPQASRTNDRAQQLRTKYVN